MIVVVKIHFSCLCAGKNENEWVRISVGAFYSLNNVKSMLEFEKSTLIDHRKIIEITQQSFFEWRVPRNLSFNSMKMKEMVS
jgi:hypothetical protein